MNASGEDLRAQGRAIGHGILDAPELSVVIFAFLLHFVWEFWQVPFYQQMPTAPHWEGVKFCSLATLGDAGIALISFWGVAAAVGSRAWILEPSGPQVLGFVAIGVGITLVAEWIATDVLHRWAYAERMPTLPLLGTGILPLLQWIVLPPLVVWFVRRHLAGRPA